MYEYEKFVIRLKTEGDRNEVPQMEESSLIERNGHTQRPYTYTCDKSPYNFSGSTSVVC